MTEKSILESKSQENRSQDRILPSKAPQRVSGEILAPENALEPAERSLEELERLPFLDEIQNMLRAGWLPPAIARYIRKNYEEWVAVEEIHRVKDELAPEEMHHYILELVPHGVTVDILGDYNKLVVYQEAEVARLVREDDGSVEHKSRITFEMGRLRTMLLELSRLARAHGVELYGTSQIERKSKGCEETLTIGEILRRANRYRRVTLREVQIEGGED